MDDLLLVDMVENGTQGAGQEANSTMPPAVITVPPCMWILSEDIGDSRVRIWDTIILVPNALFLLFLLLRMKSAISKLATTSSPIFLAFYGLVLLVSIISVLRCVVSMTVNASIPAGDITDKVLWLILRFFLLSTESSVIVFGLAFGHLDSRTSIRRVLAVTFTLSLVYSTIQGSLEFIYPDPQFHVTKKLTSDNYDIFAHGGMIFLFVGSSVFFIVYTVIFILPYTRIRNRFPLPTKRSFYWYCAFLSGLNLMQAIGSMLLYVGYGHSMCAVNVTAYVYFTFYDPLIYGTFLREFFKSSSSSVLYSYKPQHDDIAEDDSVIMPYQSNYNHEDDFMSNSYNSTHFDRYTNGDIIGRSVDQGRLSIDIDGDKTGAGNRDLQNGDNRPNIDTNKILENVTGGNIEEINNGLQNVTTVDIETDMSGDSQYDQDLGDSHIGPL